MQERFSAFVQV